MIRFTHTRDELKVFTAFLQHLMEQQPADSLHREVLYQLVTRLYKKLLDSRQLQFQVTLKKSEALAFRDCYCADLTWPGPYVFAVTQPLFELIDRFQPFAER